MIQINLRQNHKKSANLEVCDLDKPGIVGQSGYVLCIGGWFVGLDVLCNYKNYNIIIKTV